METVKSKPTPGSIPADIMAALRQFQYYSHGRSMRQFCIDEGLSYPRFCKYARRFPVDNTGKPEVDVLPATFLELKACADDLPNSNAKQTAPTSTIKTSTTTQVGQSQSAKPAKSPSTPPKSNVASKPKSPSVSSKTTSKVPAIQIKDVTLSFANGLTLSGSCDSSESLLALLQKLLS